MSVTQTIRYTATKLSITGKKGILRPDENGYYELVVGGLNTLNSAGEYYTLEGAKELFDRSSIFMRKITSGNLRGELEHPKKLPGQSMGEYLNRLMTLDRRNECCHFSDVWLDTQYGRNNPAYRNPNLVAIVAKVKPSGPMGHVLQSSLENHKENVCFSIRGITKDYMHRGVNHRALTAIYCWDLVAEGGISIASKYDSPSLEAISDMIVTESMVDEVIQNKTLVATEDTRVNIEEAKRMFSSQHKLPTSFRW